jgi:uncharacterized protein YbjT (DUF2867 family)
MRILIIGANGFIGSHLVSTAEARGYEVLAFSRSGHVPGQRTRGFSWSFGQPIPDLGSRKLDCAIHLAHDFDGEEGARRTVESTLELAKQLHCDGVRRQLFFSSYSAGEHASSLYGRTKLLIEQKLAGYPEVMIVRPGLVLGEGGIYGKMRKCAHFLPIIPLPDGGRGELPVIDIFRLCETTLDLTSEHALTREANLFEKKKKSLKQLVLDAAQEVGRKPWILPIPSGLLMTGLKAAEMLRIPLPVNADNLAGFIANQTASYQSTLED